MKYIELGSYAGFFVYVLFLRDTYGMIWAMVL